MTSFPESTDVVVVGGGTAGTIAALQAARAGVKTVLIESGTQLGGTMTTGGVDFPGLFHAWGQQIIAGIGWALVIATVELDGSNLPDFSVAQPHAHWLHQVKINSSIYAMLAEEAVVNAGIDLLYYTIPTHIESTPHGWRLSLSGKSTQRILECRQLIDCTGNATVVDMAGYPRQRGEVTQPGTLMFRLGGYDVQKLDSDAVQAAYAMALERNVLLPGDFAHSAIGFMHFLRNGGANAQHIPDADNSTSGLQTAANVAGRQSLLRLLRFVRTLPGCEKTRLEFMAVETGVRETYRIVGAETITAEDYCQGRHYEDAVCYAFYPIDLHDARGIVPQPLTTGVVPTIPLRALIPLGSQNLLVAGRCISSDRLANSALRVQASCMAMGQAAGAAAALAVQYHDTPANIPISALKLLLQEHGAIVPYYQLS
jgi:hypothetical protein